MHSARGCWGMVQEKGSQERCSSWTVLHAQSTSALSSGFPLSQGNAEALDRWGGKAKHRLISYLLSNTSAKNYRNRIVYVKIIASQMWDLFGDSVDMDGRYTQCIALMACMYCSDSAAMWLWSPYRIRQTIIFSSCRLFFFDKLYSPQMVVTANTFLLLSSFILA